MEINKEVIQGARGRVDRILGLIEELGQYQLKEQQKDDLGVDTKSSAMDLVTRVDKESERIISEWIMENYPGDGILGEEGTHHNSDADYQWIVDPVDGTNNYAQRFPIFAISVGIKYQKVGIGGIVHIPALKEWFVGVKGEGATLNGKTIQVGDKTDLVHSLACTGFPYDKGTNERNNLREISALVPQVRGMRRTGCAAFDLCCVACGRFDIYWEMTLKEWDIAAACVILEEAGAVWKIYQEEREISIVTGNESLVQKLMPILTDSSL
ncbi:inositol monophosphatase family protein [Gottschalkiaceae bacterium SANA]|nr:inositol monophosphatase family protein [Gottschalkiaceae bacterium SANA]